MNLGINKAKKHIIRQKKRYLLLTILVGLSILLGIMFWFIISNNDTIMVKEHLTTFFTNISNKDNLNYVVALNNSLTTNLGYILLIWLLGMSIIGFPFIILLIGIKSFIFGFSISSLIASLGFKSIPIMIVYLFPHQPLFLLLLVLIGFYALSFCIKLFRYLFLKENINFKFVMRKYIKILLLCCIVSLILSIYETFVATYLMGLLSSLV